MLQTNNKNLMQKLLALTTAILFSAMVLGYSANTYASLHNSALTQAENTAYAGPKPFSQYNKPLTQYALSQWSTRDGLPHNSVNSITQSNNGYLWLATWEGPVRFDGRSFLVFDNVEELQVPELGVVGIGHNPVTDEIYISGLRGGVSRFNGEHWQGLPLAPSFAFRVLVDELQNVWVTASNMGLVRYDTEGNMHRYQQSDGLPGNFTYHLYESAAADERSREVWVGTGGGLARYDSDSDRFVAIPSVSGSQVRAVLQHSNGMLLVASDHGLFFQNEPETDFLPWPTPIEGTITSLEEGPNGAIWFGTISNGLGRITDNHFSTLSIENGLPNIHVLDIFRDRENNMWVSTHGGLLQLRDALFTSFTRTQGLIGNYVRAVMTDQHDRLWVGTNEGVGRFENAQHDIPSAELAEISVLALAEDAENDRYYLGVHVDGLLQVIDDQITAKLSAADGRVLGEVRSILKLPDSDLLAVGTPIGLVIVQTNAGELIDVRMFTDNDGLVNPMVTGLELDDQGNMWVASTAGISKLHIRGRTSADVNDWRVEPINLDHITQARNTFAALNHDQRMWFATDRGVLVYTEANCGQASSSGADAAPVSASSSACWRWLSRRNGLPFDKYFSIAFDLESNLWLGSSRGVTRVSQQSLQGWLDDSAHAVATTHYVESDGMSSSQINTGGPASTIDSDGHIWFASARGVTVVAPEEFGLHGLTPPPPVIEKARSNAGAFMANAEVAADDDRIEFQYIGLGYRMAAHIEYQVKLHGFDDEWISRGNLTVAEYTSLPPGDFVFSVRSRYPGGDWSDSVDIAFSKAHHYYQTWWFWLLVGAGVVAFIGYRVRSLRKNQERLERLVEEKTAALEALAHEDALTGLPNRRAFDQRLQLEVKRSLRNGSKLSLAVLDLDHFKQINDQYLHESGDQVLQKLAQVLTDSIREIDYVARWGGEEFAILFPGASRDEAKAVCERIRLAIDYTDFTEISRGIHVTASIGVAEIGSDFDYQNLMVRADKALYQAKDNGRNTVCFG